MLNRVHRGGVTTQSLGSTGQERAQKSGRPKRNQANILSPNCNKSEFQMLSSSDATVHFLSCRRAERPFFAKFRDILGVGKILTPWSCFQRFRMEKFVIVALSLQLGYFLVTAVLTNGRV